jgi:choline dehydrogenase-like flavoprotein
MAESFDVVVVGSGAGGGVVAGELAERGLAVLLLEAGRHLTAADFSRWEARAGRASLNGHHSSCVARADGEGVTLFRGRCVGGGTTINTKVGLRAHASDYEKWFAASGLLGAGGEPFGEADLLPHYERVEARLGIRERSDWLPFVAGTARGFEALGASLSPVRSYTDANCMRCGSCLQGCPTNAGKSTLNTYIHDAWALGKLELRAECEVRRVVIEDRGSGPEAAGVEYLDRSGATHLVAAGAVVVACGTLATPGLLLRSGVLAAAGDSPSSRQIGRNLGFHPSRLVMGLLDEVQDAHRAYPITAHCMDFQTDDAGGFVVESATIMDPIGFATSVRGEDGAPLWGDELVEVMDDYRGRQRSLHRGLQRARARARRPRPRLLRRRAARGGREARAAHRPVHDARPGQLQDGQRPGALGARRQLRVPRRAPPVRRRRLGRAEDAVGQPVADVHGAGGSPRRVPRGRRARPLHVRLSA